MKNKGAPLLRPIVFFCFFVSGFCGLVYQIVWVRLAFASFGVITPVMSVIVSIFMLGLGMGALSSGRWLASWPRPVLMLYALTEFGVAVLAAAVPFLFRFGQHLLLVQGEMNSAGYLLRSALIIGAAIFPACFFMGLTLPTMMGFLQAIREDAQSFSLLYLANVLGALCGVAATAVVLIEWLGFQRTANLAVAGNVMLALGTWVLSWRVPAVFPATSRSDARPWGASRVWSILFLTGFVSMACEVLWTRAFTPVFGTTIYSFAAILAIYLSGTAAGSGIYRAFRSRSSPSSIGSLLSGVFIALHGSLLLSDPRAGGGITGVIVAVLPFCVLLGWLTPLLVDQVAEGKAGIAGYAYACNIAGCVVGPLIASYLLLPYLGFRFATILLSLGILWVSLPHLRRRW